MHEKTVPDLMVRWLGTLSVCFVYVLSFLYTQFLHSISKEGSVMLHGLRQSGKGKLDYKMNYLWSGPFNCACSLSEKVE